MNVRFWSVIVMRMMSLDELIDSVKTFLAGIDPGAPARVTAQTHLLDANLLDSLSLVHFVLFIEQTLRPLVEEMFADRPDAPPPAREYFYELHDFMTA